MSRDPEVSGARAHPEVLPGFRDFSGRYDGVLCDVWGVVHNGVRAWPDACDALFRFREAGGRVVLITNAPRLAGPILAQLEHLEVPRHSFDEIVTSGELTRALVAERSQRRVFHLGPARDEGVFDGLNVPRAGAGEAEVVVNTGLFDDLHETPEDYRDMLAAFRTRDVEMICANPDVIVERGDRMVYCAGALADAYEATGGRVIWAGKPHLPIYDEALKRLDRTAGREIERHRVLAIGDSLRTDLTGAARAGLDALFVASGIHAAELVGAEGIDLPRLEQSFRQAAVWPKAVMSRLVW